jgi:hypothetical protein
VLVSKSRPLTSSWYASFENPQLRLVLTSAFVSLLGDQFTLVALPWLVLKLEGGSLALGLMSVATSIPRAFLLFFAGALTDRYSPIKTLMWAKVSNTVLFLLLAAFVFAGSIHIGILYLFAIATGIIAALSMPSSSSVMPRIVPVEQLQTANSMLEILAWTAQLAGPSLAGALIALLEAAGNGWLVNNSELGVIFLLDGSSFALSAAILSAILSRHDSQKVHRQAASHTSITVGLRYLLADHNLRNIILYTATAGALLGGSIQVSLPILAHDAFGDGAAGLGTLMTAMGSGGIAGMLISAARPGWRIRTMGLTILIGDVLSGCLMISLGRINGFWPAILILFLAGVISGFLQIRITTWTQRRVAEGLLGKVMSLNYFVLTIARPCFACLTGWLLQVMSLQSVFTISGGALVLISLLVLARSELRSIDL